MGGREQAITWDPVDETLYQRRIQLHLAAHRPAAARRTFDALCASLRDIVTPNAVVTRAYTRWLRTVSNYLSHSR